MYDKGITSQYIQLIKYNGYNYSKDVLGFYFDDGVRKFSIMKVGPTFQCFLNAKTENGWMLVKKSNNILQFSDCLVWVLNNIQKK